MPNTVIHTTYLAEAADTAARRFDRLTPAGFLRRSGCDEALVERQMR